MSPERNQTTSPIGSFARYFTLTRRYIRGGLFVLLLLNLMTAAVESLGILLFIPFLSELTGVSTSGDRVGKILYTLLDSWHIPLSIGPVLVALVLVFTLKGLLVFFFNAYRPVLLNRAGHAIRENLLELYSRADYRYAMNKSSGFFANLVVTETERAGMGMDSFCRALAALITACILFVIAFACYGLISAMILVAAGISLLLFRKLAQQTREISLRMSTINSGLFEFLIQALQSFKYLKSTGRFPELQKQLSEANREGRRIRNRLAFIHGLRNATQEPLVVICLALILYWTVVVSHGNVPSVTVAVLFMYRCMIDVGHFHNHWQLALHYAGGLEAIRATEEELSDHREETGPQTPPSFEESIELKSVTFKYDQAPVLTDVDLLIRKNTSVALVGISGAGKTTLVDLLTGVLKPACGSVLIDGRDLSAVNLSDLRKRIGYVGQDTVIFDDSIASNISMQLNRGLDDHLMGRIREAARDSYCDEFISQFPQDYSTPVGERGVKLSGGQRQRLAIARELFRNPALLILDEATSSLDSQSEQYIQQSIERMQGELTMILISHRLSTIRNVDFIYVLDQGRIVEKGTFAELIESGGAFARMCQLQRVV